MSNAPLQLESCIAVERRGARILDSIPLRHMHSIKLSASEIRMMAAGRKDEPKPTLNNGNSISNGKSSSA